MRSSMVLLVLLVCPLACAGGSTVDRLDQGVYRITCSDLSLDRCLSEAANNACDRRPYFVVRAISDVNNRGQSTLPDVVQSSQAVVRCGPPTGWGEEGKALMSPAAPAAPAVPAAAPRPPASICAPGSTQACVGTAACQGGQACKQDGSGYLPCDCGSPPASPLPPAQPSAPPPSP